MDSGYEEELIEEKEYLENKKISYGWTIKDADRYEYIIKKLETSLWT